MTKTILLLLILITTSNFAQETDYARFVLDTLCSPHFDGRGVYNDGEKRAANFIRDQYKSFGLKSFNSNYFQYFTHPANTITGNLALQIETTSLIAGQDYIVSPDSPSFKGLKKLRYLTTDELVDLELFKTALANSKETFLVIDKTLIAEASKDVKTQVAQLINFLKFTASLPIAGIVELTDGKLTYSASQETALRPHITILKKAFPKSAATLSVTIENEFTPRFQSQNVIGYIEGKQKNKYLFITAHYDHLGRMGNGVYFPGANDNASGVAMLLSLAKTLAKENPKYSIVCIAFGSEEIGLEGSRFYTEHPIVPLENIQFLLNLDILGTGIDGIKVVNGKVHRKAFDKLVSLNTKKNYLKDVKIRGKACNSDHCFFSEKGVPSFFIYTLGGIAHYHNIYDKSETLPLTEFDDLFCLLKTFIKTF